MMRQRFARDLLVRYEQMLNDVQKEVETLGGFGEGENVIPDVLNALRDIADPQGANHQKSQLVLEKELGHNFIQFMGINSSAIEEFIHVANEMKQHPYDYNVYKSSQGYVSFFRNTLPEIAFSPYVALHQATKGIESEETILFLKIVLVLPLIIPTVVTALCAALIAIAAGLVSPFVFAGAAIADACANAADEDFQPSLAH